MVIFQFANCKRLPEGMAMAISYNWLFLWDYHGLYILFWWGFLSTYKWKKKGLNCMNWEFHEFSANYFWDDCD